MGALDDFSSARTGQGLTLTAASRVPASDCKLPVGAAVFNGRSCPEETSIPVARECESSATASETYWRVAPCEAVRPRGHLDTSGASWSFNGVASVTRSLEVGRSRRVYHDRHRGPLRSLSATVCWVA